jgi:predicted ATPase/class 3 adenylate cyclase
VPIPRTVEHVPPVPHVFLFTDIAGSTRLWERHPDAMTGALEVHDEILRSAVESSGGEVFAEMGDGIAAAFDSVDAAVRAAVAAQLALRAQAWGPTGELRVRMAIHAGPAQRRGGSYFGPTLNRCARLMAVAHGGQVLLSGAARAGITGWNVEDLGRHRLRDLAAPEHVFQLQASGLEADFPPLASVDLRPGNLPLQITSFVGRDDEVASVLAALRTARVVTITGVGGVGKTRLALQTAAEALPGFADGAWLCELAAVGDPAAVPHAVASLFGVRGEPGRPLVDSVTAHLRSSTALLVLDNCEHVLEAIGALAEEIVRSCPRVVVLATSREPLNVTGEVLRPLRALDVATAVELFAERSASVRPDFALTAENDPVVAEICRRLEGVPLALELAAARVSSMTPAEIERRLGERFRLLTGGRRTAMERQRTLRGAVDWSYDLLDRSEQRVFATLAVFAGGFTLDAAEAVASPGDGVLDALDSLVRKSMLAADVRDVETRYSMLETLRQYAEEKLDALGESDDARRRHAEHFAGVAEAGDAATRGQAEAEWRPRLAAELDNFRAAISWAVDRDEPLLAARIVAGLGLFAFFHMWSEFETWARATTDILDAAGARVPDPIAGRAYAYAAEHIRSAGDLEHADALAQRGLRLRGLDDGAVAALEHAAANLRLAAGDLSGAMTADGRALVAAQRWPDPSFLALSLTHLSLTWAAAADPGRAYETGRRAVEVARRTGSPTLLSYSAFAAGESLLDVDADRAVVHLEEAEEAARSVDNTFMIGLIRLSIVSALGRSEQPRRAVEGYLDLLGHWDATANRLQQHATLRNAAELLSRCGRLDVAAAVHGAMAARAVEPPAGSPEAHRLQASLAAARAALGDESYEGAVARGALLTDDELVTLVRAALEGLGAA